MYRVVLIVATLFASVGYTSVAVADGNARTKMRHDNEVLKLVLNDLARYDKPNRPLSIEPHTPRKIYFSRSVIDHKPQASKPLAHERIWAAMPDKEQRLVRDAMAHLGERHNSQSFEWKFVTTNDAIVLVENPTDRGEWDVTIPYSARYPIQAWPPGYSDDVTCAVVHLYFPQIFHPSYATYVLIFEQGTWAIKYRAIMTYV